MLFLTAFWTRKTAWGLFIECVGDNEQAATYAGISSRAVKFVVYIFPAYVPGWRDFWRRRISKGPIPTTPDCFWNSTPLWPWWSAGRPWPAGDFI